LTTSSIRTLAAGHSSKTLNELARDAALVCESETPASVEGIIRHLVEAGLLAPLAQTLKKPLPASIPTTITSVIVLTAGRQHELRRALDSYTDNFCLYEKDVQIIVADDSKTDSMEVGKYALSETASRTAVRIVNRRQKEAYVSLLVDSGIHPDIASFAILGRSLSGLCSIGANRNSALLDTVGECIFTVDDDTTCQLFPHPSADNALVLSSGENPRESWFFDDRDQLLCSTKSEVCDILGEHERLLGKTLSEVCTSTPLNSVHVSNASADLLRAIETGNGHIVATMSGIAGDSATHSSASLLTATGFTKQELAQNESLYRKAFRSREVFGVVRTFTVMHSRFCMTTSLGLDNRDLIPPFFPVGRNEDGVFGALVSMMNPAMLIGHVPTAIFHAPPPPRESSSHFEFRVSDLIISLLLLVSNSRKSGIRDLLRYLGRELLEIARLGESDFWMVISRAVTLQISKRLRQLELILADSECPRFWRDDVSDYAHRICVQCTEPTFAIPIELKQDASIEIARYRTRDLVARAGSLLYSWPDLVNAASDLRKRGLRLSTILRSDKK
jgi:hypothetical protein